MTADCHQYQGTAGTDRRGFGQRGITLVELMVTLVLTTIFIAIVMNYWTDIARHVFRQQQRTTVRQAADRVAMALSAELRKSPGVVGLPWDGIAYISGATGDTIAYRMDEEGVLRRNGMPVHMGSRHIVTERFAVSLGASAENDPGSRALVSVHMAFDDTTCCTATSHIDVQVPVMESARNWSGW